MKFFRLALIASFAVSLSAQNNNAEESLFQAIQSGDTAAVARLIDDGVSANITDEEGIPVLMLATLFADAECVEVLLEGGADPNQADAVGATALMWAVPDLEKVRLLIDHGADVNARSDGLGRTALLIAAGYPGTSSVLELLLDHGADQRATDPNGFTALAMAMRSSDVGVLRFLVDRGMDPGEEVPAAALRAVYVRDRPETIDYLMSRGLRITEGALIDASNRRSPRVDRAMDRAGSKRQCRGPPLRQDAVADGGIFGTGGPGDVTAPDRKWRRPKRGDH